MQQRIFPGRGYIRICFQIGICLEIRARSPAFPPTVLEVVQRRGHLRGGYVRIFLQIPIPVEQRRGSNFMVVLHETSVPFAPIRKPLLQTGKFGGNRLP